MKKILLLTLLPVIFTPLACAEQSSDNSAKNKHQLLQIEDSYPHKELLNQLDASFPAYKGKPVILVSISEQMLYFYANGVMQRSYPVSTATNGVGSQSGSGKTPLGAHRVSQRFGEGAPSGTIFKARKNTGKIAKIITDPVDVPSDDVTTRVLWLDGLEPGKNKGGKVDSHKRYIYIHGTPEEGLIGSPASHGCIRMLNRDVIDLFSMSPVDTLVYIME